MKVYSSEGCQDLSNFRFFVSSPTLAITSLPSSVSPGRSLGVSVDFSRQRSICDKLLFKEALHYWWDQMCWLTLHTLFSPFQSVPRHRSSLTTLLVVCSFSPLLRELALHSWQLYGIHCQHRASEMSYFIGQVYVQEHLRLLCRSLKMTGLSPEMWRFVRLPCCLWGIKLGSVWHDHIMSL